MWNDRTLHNHKECTKTERYCLHHYSEQLTRTFAVLVSSEIIHVSLYVSLKASMKIHSQGCMAVISHHMKENITMIVAIIVGTLFVQVLNWVVQEPDLPFNLLLQFLGLVFSFCLANSIKKECEIVWVLDLGMLSKCCPCSDSSSRTRSRKQYFVRASPGDGELVNLWN